MLALNPRGRVPVLKDGDYVCFESLAVLYYLDLKYPEPPIFGRTPEEAGMIMRVICEYQAYIEPHVMKIVARGVFREAATWRPTTSPRPCTSSAARRAPSKAGCRSRTGWSATASPPSTWSSIPGIQLLHPRARAAARRASCRSRFLPVEVNYPALGRWLARVAALPGYERTYPPHWREP